MIKSAKKLTSRLIFSSIVCFIAIYKGIVFKKHITGYDCARICALIETEFFGRLCRNFAKSYAQVNDHEMLFFYVLATLRIFTNKKIEIEITFNPLGLTKIIFEDHDRWIICPVHFPERPYLNFIANEVVNKNIFLITSDPDSIRNYAIDKIYSNIDHITFIKNDKACLKQLDFIDRNNSIIVACPDFSSTKDGFCDKVSGGIFKYAFTSKTKLASMSFLLTNTGSIDINFDEVNITSDINNSIHQFIIHQSQRRAFSVI